MGDGKWTPAMTARYYEREIAGGAEDYYSAGARADAGRWVGAGAKHLELEGEAQEGELQRLLKGCHPKTGEKLVERRHQVHGFDFTASPPKSVSVLAALGGDDVRREVREAHTAAVDASLAHFEEHACGARLGRAGVERVAGGGWIGVAYHHHCSRNGDPQEHTHVVVANMTRAPDGRYLSLDSKRAFHMAKSAGHLYEAHLRAELTERLGVRWRDVGEDHPGWAEVDHIPPELSKHFSSRTPEIEGELRAQQVERELRARVEISARTTGKKVPEAERARLREQIERELIEHPERVWRGRRARDVAALKTRSQKKDIEPETLLRRWRAEAQELEHEVGFEVDDVVRQATSGARTRETIDYTAAAAAIAGLRGVTGGSSTFTPREALQAWADAHRRGARVAEVEQLAARFVADREYVLKMGGDEPRPPGEELLTTRDMLSSEVRLQELVREGLSAGRAVGDPEALERVLAKRRDLSEEQRAAVRHLVTSGHGIDTLSGPAGSAKTEVLAVACEVWRQEDRAIVGGALAGVTADEVQRRTKAATHTLTRLLEDLDTGGGLKQGGIVLVDETSMVGTRQLLSLAEHTHRARGKLVLSGDPRQLPAIEAGGAFADLVDRGYGAQVTRVFRQRDRDDIEAAARLAQGEVTAFVAHHDERGGIVRGGTREEQLQRLLRDWQQDPNHLAPGGAAIIAATRADERELNQAARVVARTEGALGRDRKYFARGDDGALRPLEIATGDRVLFRKNDKGLDVRNGHFATVQRAHKDHVSVRLDHEDRMVKIPLEYIERGNLAYGYATTAQKCQGRALETTYLFGTEAAYQEWLYSAATRHREKMRLYVVETERQLVLGETPRPVEEFTRAAERSQAKEMAMAQISVGGENREAERDQSQAPQEDRQRTFENRVRAAAEKWGMPEAEVRAAWTDAGLGGQERTFEDRVRATAEKWGMPEAEVAASLEGTRGPDRARSRTWDLREATRDSDAIEKTVRESLGQLSREREAWTRDWAQREAQRTGRPVEQLLEAVSPGRRQQERLQAQGIKAVALELERDHERAVRLLEQGLAVNGRAVRVRGHAGQQVEGALRDVESEMRRDHEARVRGLARRLEQQEQRAFEHRAKTAASKTLAPHLMEAGELLLGEAARWATKKERRRQLERQARQMLSLVEERRRRSFERAARRAIREAERTRGGREIDGP